MAARREVPTMIGKGWIKALLLVLIYTIFSILASTTTTSIHTAVLMSAVIGTLLVYFFRRFLDRRSFSSLGFTRNHLLPDLLIGITLGAALVCLGAVLIFLFRGIEWIDIYVNTTEFAVGVGSMVLVAFTEELIFRGYVLRNLLKSFNKWLALVISAGLFTLVHLSNPGIPILGVVNILLGGLITGLAFIYSRGLWMSMGFHFAWNLFQGPVLGFPVSGFAFSSLLTIDADPTYPFISGGKFGFEGSFICALLLLIASAAAIRKLRRLQAPGQ